MEVGRHTGISSAACRGFVADFCDAGKRGQEGAPARLQAADVSGFSILGMKPFRIEELPIMANGALEAYSESRSLNRVQMFAWGFVWIALILDVMDWQFLAMSSPVRIERIRVFHVEHGNTALAPLIGAGIGGILSGWIADRMGRVKTMFLCMCWYSDVHHPVSVCRLTSADACIEDSCRPGVGSTVGCRQYSGGGASAFARPNPGLFDYSDGFCLRPAPCRLFQ